MKKQKVQDQRGLTTLPKTARRSTAGTTVSFFPLLELTGIDAAAM